jgi:hypothetical protein
MGNADDSSNDQDTYQMTVSGEVGIQCATPPVEGSSPPQKV